MKKIAFALLLCTVGLTGCLPMDFLRDKPKPPPVKLVEKAPPIVTEDQVNDKNAPDQARALRAEIEYARQHRSPAQQPE